MEQDRNFLKIAIGGGVELQKLLALQLLGKKPKEFNEILYEKNYTDGKFNGKSILIELCGDSVIVTENNPDYVLYCFDRIQVSDKPEFDKNY